MEKSMNVLQRKNFKVQIKLMKLLNEMRLFKDLLENQQNNLNEEDWLTRSEKTSQFLIISSDINTR